MLLPSGFVKRPPSVLLIFFAMAALLSCKKDVPATVNFDYGYFPSSIGKYIVYDVDSVYRTSFDYKLDTVRYQLKEVIDSIYTDNTGRPTMKINRYRKLFSSSVPYSAMPWTLLNIWSANRTLTDAERVEDNVRYVKLVFPVVLYQTWNGNAFNTQGLLNYYYSSIDQTAQIEGANLDSVLTVIQIADSNNITEQFATEKYAKNIGLIYRHVINVTDNSKAIYGFPFNSNNNNSNKDSAVGIVSYTETMNSHN